MFVRRSFAVIAAASALCAVTAPAASARAAGSAAAAPGSAAAPAGKLPDGLYGKSDPKYDGVWRQSVALLAQKAAGAKPAAEAVEWLARQQCDDGSFTSYRADPGAECDAKKTPSDTNATALAVQALSAVGGRGGTVRDSLDWLESVQNEDGGWGYNPGSPSDANSVSVVIGAYSAAGRDAERIRKDGDSPYDALRKLQLGCDADESDRGAYAYQPGKKGELEANGDATAAATLAGFGSGLLVGAREGDGGGTAKGKAPKQRPLEPPKCGKDGKDGDGKLPGGRTEAAEAGAAHLAAVLKKGGGHLRAVTPGAEGGPDYGNTADAVIALAAGGHRAEAEKSLDWLAGGLGKWDKSRNDPAAIGGVMLAVHATGGDAAKLGKTALLERLNATGPRPARMPDADGGGNGEEDGGDFTKWSLVGAGIAAGAGVGILLSGRRKRQGL